MSDDKELLEIRKKKMESLMRSMKEQESPSAIELLENGHVNHLNTDNFWNTIKKTKIALIDFYGTWCKPCQALTPILNELAKKYRGKVFFGKIDIDNNPQISGQFSIQSIPIVFAFKNGSLSGNLLGLRPYGDYNSWIQHLLS